MFFSCFRVGLLTIYFLPYIWIPPCGPHCNGNPIFVFLFWELRGFRPNFHIHVSVSDLYIPRIGPHISCSRTARLVVGIYESFTDAWMGKLGLWPRNSFSVNICFEFSVLVLCSAVPLNYVEKSQNIGTGDLLFFTIPNIGGTYEKRLYFSTFHFVCLALYLDHRINICSLIIKV
jgi:hypothetical protein